MTRLVLHLIETSGPGGAERMLISMVEGLKHRGIQSCTILIKDGWLREALEAVGSQVKLLPLKRTIDSGWLRKAAQLVEDQEADVIHSHEFAMNVYGTLLGRLTGRRCIATIHGKNYYGDRMRRRFAYRYVARFSRMVAVSEDIRQYLNEGIGIPENRVQVIANGIHTSRFQFDSKLRERTRRELRYGKYPVLGAIGNLYPVKGHQVLLRAAVSILEERPDVKIFIAGRGSEEEILKRQAKELGIGHAISFLGFREDVHSLLCAMDVFVLPSISEGHPLSLLEAMACERPVIASNVGGLPEVIEDGREGYLFRVADHQELSMKVIGALDEVEATKAVAERGRRRVIEAYSLDAMLGAYMDLYRARERGMAAVRENS
ncbi:glycosyltransferase [Thiohalomonas denitrificans]|uniref:glycosyltransferase n=1 Tax=Thiohalomonas denitrificans TaxID=415747 RepID=UPI0026EA00AE|nr:glycosyltransferase [Thiohalomonas denitrificans]